MNNNQPAKEPRSYFVSRPSYYERLEAILTELQLAHSAWDCKEMKRVLRTWAQLIDDFDPKDNIFPDRKGGGIPVLSMRKANEYGPYPESLKLQVMGSLGFTANCLQLLREDLFEREILDRKADRWIVEAKDCLNKLATYICRLPRKERLQ